MKVLSVGHLPYILFSLACALWCVDFLGLQWLPSYCFDQHSGPGYMAFGFPLPYQQFGGVSSLQYNYLIWAKVVNLVVMTSLLSLCMVPLGQRLPGIVRSVCYLIGLLLIAAFMYISFSMHNAGMLTPVDQLSEPFWSFRPWGFGSLNSHVCPQLERL